MLRAIFWSSSESVEPIYLSVAGGLQPAAFQVFQDSPQGTCEPASLCLCRPVFSCRVSGDAAVIYSASAAAAQVKVDCDSRMNERLSHLLAHSHGKVYFRLQAELFLFTVWRQ